MKKIHLLVMHLIFLVAIVLIFLIIQKEASLLDGASASKQINGACGTAKNPAFLDGLPENFSISLYGDGTSSGAGRTYRSYLTFKGDKVVSGNTSYEAGNQFGYRDCVQIYNPSTNEWGAPSWRSNGIEMQDADDSCLGLFSYPFLVSNLTREKIICSMNLGIIISRNESTNYCHNQFCYEITEE